MKLLIVGLACSGKSTFSLKVGAKTDVAVIHMDKLIWQENWLKVPYRQFLDLQERALSRTSWV